MRKVRHIFDDCSLQFTQDLFSPSEYYLLILYCQKQELDWFVKERQEATGVFPHTRQNNCNKRPTGWPGTWSAAK